MTTLKEFFADKTEPPTTITEVQPNEDGGGWYVSLKDSGGCWVESTLCSEPPKVGDKIILIGSFGQEIRGILIGGRVYRYSTKAELKAKHKRELETLINKRQAELDETRPERNVRRLKLPHEFQARLDRMQRAVPTWRRDHEPYELFTCEEAVKIATIIRDLIALARLEVNESSVRDAIQKVYDDPKTAEGLSTDHSGNTFGAACSLARIWVLSPEHVVKSHAAICPLVGCTAAGCWAGYEARTSS